MADKNEFIPCIDEKTAVNLENRLRMCLDFVSPFRWLIEAYVSDFFVNNLWDKLLPCWRRKLEMMSPPQQSVLLDSAAFTENKDLQLSCFLIVKTLLPLSMLAYIKCIDSLSLNRQCVDLDESETVQEITSMLVDWNSSQMQEQILLETKGKFEGKYTQGNKERCDTLTANTDRSDSKKRKLSPSSMINGQDFSLRNVFRKHVKPKKQHEIGRLAKGVSIVSEVSQCKNIVDVGAGLGHLSRILAFNQGLTVTTVEAAGTHAPKAFKYDREMEKDISKALKRLPKGETESGSVEVKSFDQVLPSHVVCRISPDITPQHFLQLLQQKYTEPHCQISTDNKHSLEENTSSDRALKDSEFESEKDDLSYNYPSQPSAGDFKTETCVSDKENRKECVELADTDNDQSELSTGDFRTAICVSDEEKECSGLVEDKKLILCGLHACGDLTSTLLRMFVSCDNIVGVASVGCCYMKLSCR
ncbi:hypothetical protein LOTGIDRAFT_157966 [Lottia gigantea]|uniref:Methyltransferase domain-containing protein n=1 Tax=Lottia gigantea TaxID=225164 RepID=V4AZU8_LOTGI|nr:hypothetical protein LOTGIDRAFT_157966 [Lottia gigantea]ESP00676.1 hypothetical protein LOTGIDRAFT_157966 [Lottia gigantea]